MTTDITEISTNLSQYLTNSLNITRVYFDMFFNPEPMDIELEQYDSDGILQTYTVPNRAKDRRICDSGEGSPEGNVEATLGTFYIDSETSSLYIKTSETGSNGWEYVLTETNLIDHNTSTDAHEGYLAKINGDSSEPFNVATPTTDTQAVNRAYTGNKNLLYTENTPSFVDGINENFVRVSAGYSNLSVYNAHIDSETNEPSLLAYLIGTLNNGCTVTVSEDTTYISGLSGAYYLSGITFPIGINIDTDSDTDTDTGVENYELSFKYTHGAQGSTTGVIMCASKATDEYSVPRIKTLDNALTLEISTDDESWNVVDDSTNIIEGLETGTEYSLKLTYSSTTGYAFYNGEEQVFSSEVTDKVSGGTEMYFLNSPEDTSAYYCLGTMNLDSFTIIADGSSYFSGTCYNAISFNAGNTYVSMQCLDKDGLRYERTSDSTTDPLTHLSIFGHSNVTYHVLVPKVGEPYFKELSIITTDEKPSYDTEDTTETTNVDVIWQSNTVIPFTREYYSIEDGWLGDFTDLVVGTVTFDTSGNVTDVTTFPYLNNNFTLQNTSAGKEIILDFVDTNIVELVSDHIDEVVDLLADKMDDFLSKTGTEVVVETYSSGTSGYRIWSDNYCEQWGQITVATAATIASTAVSYYTSFASVPNIQLTIVIGATMTTSNMQGRLGYSSSTVSGFSLTGGVAQAVAWKAVGYIS